MNKSTILLTGATGYIGSHTWLALLQAGFDVVGVDNFSNSSPAGAGAPARAERTGADIRADRCLRCG